MKTVYVIAMEGEGPTGLDWYDTREARDAAGGKSGAEYEVHFEMEVDPDEEHDMAEEVDDPEQQRINNITQHIDDACWNCVWRDGRPFKVVVPHPIPDNVLDQQNVREAP